MLLLWCGGVAAEVDGSSFFWGGGSCLCLLFLLADVDVEGAAASFDKDSIRRLVKLRGDPIWVRGSESESCFRRSFSGDVRGRTSGNKHNPAHTNTVPAPHHPPINICRIQYISRNTALHITQRNATQR